MSVEAAPTLIRAGDGRPAHGLGRNKVAILNGKSYLDLKKVSPCSPIQATLSRPGYEPSIDEKKRW